MHNVLCVTVTLYLPEPMTCDHHLVHISKIMDYPTLSYHDLLFIVITRKLH